MNDSVRFLVPKEGQLVRDPVTRTPLDTKGEWKDWEGTKGIYWRRRLKDGDVLIQEPVPLNDVKESIVESNKSKQSKINK